MENYIWGLLLVSLIFSCNDSTPANTSTTKTIEESKPVAQYAIAIHGGAGAQSRENTTDEKDKMVRAALNRALDAAERIVKANGYAGDAVIEAIKVLEDDPNFNAGKGAVFTYDEKNELDASFMEGANMNAGAVGGVTNIKNPILAARAVMEESPHVLLVGKGAEEFAALNKIEQVDPSYFMVEERLETLRNRKKQDKSRVSKFGTVGCVVKDKSGNLAAGTSTGGMTYKRWNRIGDSPIIGAGTYANNNTCAVSSTGHGEFFIRYAVAHDISALMEYKGLSLKEAGELVVNEKLVKAGGQGGVITVDKFGNVSMPFNTDGMYRGFATDKNRGVAIYKDEELK